MKQPRGLRNNNPGNLRVSNSDWVGKIAKENNTDGTFEQFETMESGVRALTVLIINYYYRYSRKTIRSILQRYAPPNENPTEKYITYVVERTGGNPNAFMDEQEFAEKLPKIVEGIIYFENGKEAPSKATKDGIIWAMNDKGMSSYV